MFHEYFHEKNLIVPRHMKDVRFDAALTLLSQELNLDKKALSRSFFRNLIEEKGVRLNDMYVKPSTKVDFRDNIVFEEQKKETENKKEYSGTIGILSEDKNILVINKPGDIAMHAAKDASAFTIADWILKHYPALKRIGEDPMRPGIVHRLDKETSGVVVIAKNQKTFEELKSVFQNREMEKTYVALVYGHLVEREGKIDLSLTRKSGELKRKAVDPNQRTGKLSGNIRTALTYYSVVARFSECDLVRLRPKTGRTHQIRVHMSALGHPVVGDKLYAFKPAKQGRVLFPGRHLLHAYSLSFDLSGKKYTFTAPIPQDFKEVLVGFGPSSEALT